MANVGNEVLRKKLDMSGIADKNTLNAMKKNTKEATALNSDNKVEIDSARVEELKTQIKSITDRAKQALENMASEYNTAASKGNFSDNQTVKLKKTASICSEVASEISTMQKDLDRYITDSKTAKYIEDLTNDLEATQQQVDTLKDENNQLRSDFNTLGRAINNLGNDNNN